MFVFAKSAFVVCKQAVLTLMQPLQVGNRQPGKNYEGRPSSVNMIILWNKTDAAAQLAEKPVLSFFSILKG